MNIHQKINVRSYFNPVEDDLNDCRANRPRILHPDQSEYMDGPITTELVPRFKGWKKYELRNIKK